MFFETQLRQLIRLRTDYWQLETISQRNLKLSQMVLAANACGMDIIEFLLETKSEMQKAKAAEKAEIIEKELFAKAPEEDFILQKQSSKSTTSNKKAVVFLRKLKCPFCNYTTDSAKALSGHQKRHSSKYQSLNVTV